MKIMRLVTRYIEYVQTRGIVSATVIVIWHLLDAIRWKLLMPVKMRYYRAVCGSMGERVQFYDGVRVIDPHNLFIGNNVYINVDTCIWAGGGVHIGDNTSIGLMVTILSTNHTFGRLDIPIREQDAAAKPVVIEDDVWLGSGCIIIPGVRIGKGSVIAAGAVVTHNIPPYSIAQGLPARVVRSRLELLDRRLGYCKEGAVAVV